MVSQVDFQFLAAKEGLDLADTEIASQVSKNYLELFQQAQQEAQRQVSEIAYQAQQNRLRQEFEGEVREKGLQGNWTRIAALRAEYKARGMDSPMPIVQGDDYRVMGILDQNLPAIAQEAVSKVAQSKLASKLPALQREYINEMVSTRNLRGPGGSTERAEIKERFRRLGVKVDEIDYSRPNKTVY